MADRGQLIDTVGKWRHPRRIIHSFLTLPLIVGVFYELHRRVVARLFMSLPPLMTSCFLNDHCFAHMGKLLPRMWWNVPGEELERSLTPKAESGSSRTVELYPLYGIYRQAAALSLFPTLVRDILVSSVADLVFLHIIEASSMQRGEDSFAQL